MESAGKVVDGTFESFAVYDITLGDLGTPGPRMKAFVEKFGGLPGVGETDLAALSREIVRRYGDAILEQPDKGTPR
jgi:hypothetical protein